MQWNGGMLGLLLYSSLGRVTDQNQFILVTQGDQDHDYDFASRILKTPMFLRVLCDPAPEDPNYEPLPEERPGGFDWGNDAGDGNAANGAEGEAADIQDGDAERR